MNLKWADLGGIYSPIIAPNMGKHCDSGHLTDPTRRDSLHEDAPRLALTNLQTSPAFDLMAVPNKKGHIIGPGEYQLDILVAAENARPIKLSVRDNFARYLERGRNDNVARWRGRNHAVRFWRGQSAVKRVSVSSPGAAAPQARKVVDSLLQSPGPEEC